MIRRVIFGGVLASVLAILVAGPSAAALREVAVRNFYFDDATAGDGTVEAMQGDQLRFTVYDGGPGTPHTVEVDELNIHSGSLAAGETFTTPPLNQPGTYRLYCKPHQNRGHTATLIVRANSTATTSVATTAPRSGGSSGTVTTSTTAASTPSATNADGSPASSVPADADSPGDGTDSTLAPLGRGEADPDALEDAPADPDSLQAALGRRPARKGPWTRSVRLALLVLIPMVAASIVAARRSRASTADTTPPSR